MGEIHKLRIGNVELENNIILAPMAGVSDLVFRRICREQGAGLVCSEMVSAKAILYKNKNTAELLRTDEKEHPVSIQLFGSDPDILGDMAAQVSEGDSDIIDFNMGCPMPKIVNNGEGSALLKDLRLAEKCLSAMVRSQKKPVTVKIRKGFDAEHINAVEAARMAEAAGVSAVAVHGRTREEYYSGEADWDVIAQVKRAIDIPVIGNGDIKSAEDVKRMYEQTGCDGFMIGRAARGNPWIFADILGEIQADGGIAIEKKQAPGNRSFEDIKQMLLYHAKMQVEDKGEYIGIRQMRKHAAWYISGIKNAARMRTQINEVQTYGQLKELIEDG